MSLPSYRFRTPSQRNRSIVGQMQAETERQRRQEQIEEQRRQREMQLEIRRQKQLDKEGDDRLGREFKVEQGRQRQLDATGITQDMRAQRERDVRRPTPTREPGIPSLIEDVFRQTGRVAGGPGLEEAFLPENVGGLAPRIPTQLVSEEKQIAARYAELLEETRQSFPTRTPPGTTHESIAAERLEKELQGQRAELITEARETRTPLPPGGSIAPIPSGREPLLNRGLRFLEETPFVGGPFFRDPATGKTAFEQGAEISRPVVQTVAPIVAEPFEQVEAAGIPVVSPISGGVATAIESKIVEDIATEIINPAALVLVAPIALSAASGLRGAAAAGILVSNLLGTGLEPQLIRGTLRGLTLLSREGLAALPRISKTVRATSIFQEAVRGIKTGERGGGELGGFGERFAGKAKQLKGGPPVKRPVTTFEEAKQGLVKFLDEEAKLRKSGVVAAEISVGRKAQAAGIRAGTETAIATGARGEEAATAGLRGAGAPKGLRQTVGEINLPLKQTDALFDEATRLFTRGEIEEFEFIQATVALKRGLSGRGLQPNQVDRLRSVFGAEVAEKLARRVRPISEARQLQKAARALSKTFTKVLNNAVRDAKKSVAIATRSRKAADLGNFRAARDLMGESIRAANRSDDAILLEAEELLTEARAALEGASPAALKTADNQIARLKIDMADKFAGPEDLIAKAELLAPNDPVVQETIRSWVRGNEVLLEGLSSEMGSVMATVRSVVTGDIADSFLTYLSHRRATMSYVLGRLMPGESGTVRKITDALMEAELRRRYGVDVPDKVRELMTVTKGASYDQNAGWLQTLVQRAKNTAFGFDIGVFGIQGLTAIRQGNIPMVAGMINRMLSLMRLPHVAVAYGDDILPRWVKYALDGVHQGIGPSAVRASEGTILQYVPKVGRIVDIPLIAAADKLNQLQFGYALTALRNLTYEGNLVMAHLAKLDIGNVAVRAQLAENANAIGSFAWSALKAGRAGAEKTLLISPPMTRAMVNRVLQVSKVFRLGATKAERLVGASMIASYSLSILAVGKLVHDQVGVGGFVFDPSKPGFGLINLPNGRTINLFPQATLDKAILRSFRELSKMDDADLDSLAQSWVRLGLGRSSIVGQGIASIFNTGWDPRFGFRLGDLPIDAKLLSLAPMPPVIESLVLEGPSLFAQGTEITGVSQFETSPFGQLEEKFREKALAGEFGPDRVQNPDFNPEADFRIAEQDPDLAPLVEAVNRRSLGRDSEGAVRSQQLEETRLQTEQELGLPDLVRKFQAGAPNGSTIISRYRDMQTQMAGSFNFAFLGHSPKDRESEDGRILEELGKLNPNLPPYTDFETGTTDWDKFLDDEARLEGQLSPAVRKARDDQLYSQSPELRALEPDIKLALLMRRELRNTPKWKGVSLETQGKVQELHGLVRQFRLRAGLTGTPVTISQYQDAARQGGVDPGLAFVAWPLRSGESEQLARDPEYLKFLFDYQDEMAWAFPELYDSNAILQFLDPAVRETVIAQAR